MTLGITYVLIEIILINRISSMHHFNYGFIICIINIVSPFVQLHDNAPDFHRVVIIIPKVIPENYDSIISGTSLDS